jgi:3-oxoisoapionate decarboxylase
MRNDVTAKTALNIQCKLGVVSFSYMMAWKPEDTLEFLEHCHRLGAAGIQAPITGDIRVLRARAEELEMYIEAVAPLPEHGDTSQFEQALRDADDVNAVGLRAACLATRRYETFKTLEQWQKHVKESIESIELALPLLDKYRIPLGLENHKDWTTDELAALMQKYATRYFGVCLDLGNNISLLDDPMTAIERLAPYAVNTHMKDMCVEAAAEGFRVAEVPLGGGFIDLERAISLVQQARAEARFSLEMITRDPLLIPCLSDEYWATFPDRNGLQLLRNRRQNGAWVADHKPAIAGENPGPRPALCRLERTLRFVQENKTSHPLPRVSHLSYEEQRRREDENVMACLQYARENWGVH